MKKRKMDPRLVSSQKWELTYIADKIGVSINAVKAAIKQVGRSRRKVYAYLRGW